MKKLLSVFLLTALVMGPAGYASAVPWGESQKSLEGTVKNIQNSILTVIPEGSQEKNQQRMEFVVDVQTKFEKVVSLDNLKEGDKIQVKYEEKGGQRIATVISKIDPQKAYNIQQ